MRDSAEPNPDSVTNAATGAPDPAKRPIPGRQGYPDSVYHNACELIAEGKTANEAAKRVGCTAKAIRQWALSGADNGALYARARVISAGALEDEIIEIARASTATSYQQDRLLVDSLKWAAAKRDPARYSDRVLREATGTVTVRVVRDDGPGRIELQDQARYTALPAYDNAGGDVADAEVIDA